MEKTKTITQYFVKPGAEEVEIICVDTVSTWQEAVDILEKQSCPPCANPPYGTHYEYTERDRSCSFCKEEGFDDCDSCKSRIYHIISGFSPGERKRISEEMDSRRGSGG